MSNAFSGIFERLVCKKSQPGPRFLSRLNAIRKRPLAILDSDKRSEEEKILDVLQRTIPAEFIEVKVFSKKTKKTIKDVLSGYLTPGQIRKFVMFPDRAMLIHHQLRGVKGPYGLQKWRIDDEAIFNLLDGVQEALDVIRERIPGDYYDTKHLIYFHACKKNIVDVLEQKDPLPYSITHYLACSLKGFSNSFYYILVELCERLDQSLGEPLKATKPSSSKSSQQSPTNP